MEEFCCVRSHPDEFALRKTRAGDICILLEPDDPEEMDHLKACLAELQTQFGGQAVSLVHLTCQRFAIPQNDPEGTGTSADELFARVLDALHRSCGGHAPIPLTAVSLVPIHVPFEGQNVMKWCIAISDELRAYQKHLFECLRQARVPSLYREWFVPTLITALKEIPSLEEPSQAYLRRNFPRFLFTGRRAQLSRIHGADDYEILATISV